MDGIRGLIIHLERATDRAGHVDTLCRSLPVPAEVLPAVDARDALPAGYAPDRPLEPPYPFSLRASEIAVFHSHRRAWARIVNGGFAAGLILEDDATLDPDRFPAAFALACEALTQGRFIRLPIKDREETGAVVAEAGGIRVRRPDVVGLNLQAQLVGREAARALLAASQSFDRPVDSWLQMTWVHGVEVLSVWPSGVGEMSAALGGSTQGKRRGVLAKLRAEFFRARYRRAIARRAEADARAKASV